MTLLRGEKLALVRGGRLLFEALILSLEPCEALHISGPNGSGSCSSAWRAISSISAAEGAVSKRRMGQSHRVRRANAASLPRCAPAPK